MKKVHIVLVMMLFVKFSLSAQDTLKIGVNEYLYKRLINKEFANLISPQSNNILGNFASLDLKESEVAFAGNYFFNNGSILGVKAKGGSSDGILPIFSNEKFSSKIGLNFQYNILGLSEKELYYETGNYNKYVSEKRKVNNKYELDSLNIQYKQDSLQLISELNTLKENKEKITLSKFEIDSKYDSITMASRLKKMLSKRESIKKSIEQERSKDKIDSLKMELDNTNLNIGYQENKLNNYKYNHALKQDSINLCIMQIDAQINLNEEDLTHLPSRKELEKELKIWKANEIKKLQKEIEIEGFQMGWFSIGYGIKNNSFLLINTSSVLDEQISKRNFLNHKINIQYSFYKYSPFSFSSIFASVGASVSIEDNFDELSKKDISEKQEIGDTIGERTVNKNYSVYSGEYKTDLKTISIFGDFYYFLFENNKGAFHFYPEYKIKDDYKSQINLGFGFLMSYKDKDKNIINAEVYYYLTDIENNNDSEYNLFERSQIGMRFTFPISFNSKSN